MLKITILLIIYNSNHLLFRQILYKLIVWYKNWVKYQAFIIGKIASLILKKK